MQTKRQTAPDSEPRRRAGKYFVVTALVVCGAMITYFSMQARAQKAESGEARPAAAASPAAGPAAMVPKVDVAQVVSRQLTRPTRLKYEPASVVS